MNSSACLKWAREYRQRGYAVVVEPTPEQLPRFLAAFRIDMLASNADEQVVVEVRSHASLTGAPELDALAQAIHDQPGWRFDLVVTNPRDRSGLPFKDATSLAQHDIAYRLQEARQLSTQEHGEAALLLAWSATEALLRAIAETEAIPVQPGNPAQLIKTLFAYGVVDQDQLAVLQAGFQARNLVSHGYNERTDVADVVHRLLDVAAQLEQHPPLFLALSIPALSIVLRLLQKLRPTMPYRSGLSGF